MSVLTQKIPINPDNPQPLGRHVQLDERSRMYQVQAKATSALKTVAHTRYVPILDQSNLRAQGVNLSGSPDALNSCTGNAGIGAVGSLPLYIKQPLSLRRQLRDPKSAEAQAVDLYAEATELDEFPETYPPTDDGSSGLGIAKALINKGIITSYDHAFDLQALLTALQTSPVLFGINWYESMFDAHPDGTVEISGAIAGGHEVIIDAIFMEAQKLRIANSWSPTWGDEGCFFLTFDQADRLLSEQGDAIILRA